MIKTKNKLGTYLAVSAGVGCVGTVNAATVMNAPIVVTPFGSTSTPPAGIAIGVVGDESFVDVDNSAVSVFFIAKDSYDSFFRSTVDSSTLEAASLTNTGGFYYSRGFLDGAVPGDDNFVSISLDNNEVFEAVGQFSFDGAGGGFLVALAQRTDGSALSLTEGIAAITESSVPEPSSLSLLALGAAGLVTRRNRKKAA